MKSLLIINPIAGQARPHESVADVEAAFRSSAHQTVVTSGRGDAETAAEHAAQSGEFDEVLVAGGDGTVNEVVNGLVRGLPESGLPIPLGIIPLGTQNVLAHELGLPIGQLGVLTSILRRRKHRLIDVGDADGHYFTLMAGFGFDAAVIGEVARPIKDVIGPAAYAFATLGTLAKYRSTSVRLELDDEAVHSEAFLVIVANAASYAYRQIKLAPFASLDDGWLDVCVFERPPGDRVGFVTQILAVLARRHLRDPRVRYYRARKIVLDSTPPVKGQLDGDTAGQTPVTIRIVPKALSVYVP